MLRIEIAEMRTEKRKEVIRIEVAHEVFVM
jgi:hypothetical protein